MSDVFGQRWTSIQDNTFFFYKLRYIQKFYKYYSKTNDKEYRKLELDTKANLELATATLHEDFYNVDKQEEVNQLMRAMKEIETKKARRATIRSRVN